MSMSVSVVCGCLHGLVGTDPNGGNVNLLNRYALQVSELLTQRISLGGSATDDAMRG